MDKKFTTGLVSMAALVAGSNTVAAQDWSGFYAGLSVNSNSGSSPVSHDGYDYTMSSGAVAGAFAGFRWNASDTVVMGLEVATQGTIDLDYPEGETPSGDGYQFNRLVDAKLSVGMPLSKALVYGFVGMSSGSVSDSYDNDYSASGMNYGLGVGYQATERMTVGLEYISRNMTGYADEGYADSHSNANTVSLRASFKF